jgi:hypothetical protein
MLYLPRLRRPPVQEAVITVPRALIAETINLIAVLAGRGTERRLVELTTLEGLSPAEDYLLVPSDLLPRGGRS